MFWAQRHLDLFLWRTRLHCRINVRVLARISSSARAAIREGCASAGESEACGLLLGRVGNDRWWVETATRARNISAEPRRRFEIDPTHVVAAHRAARMPGAASVIGVWHSHPGGLLFPSETDRAGATERGWLWLIADASGRHLRGFVPAASAPGGFLPVRLRAGVPIDSCADGC
ncbi:MAG: Mov34/MPN/PAD-1 family protein [Thermaurantiacus sp.]